MFHMYQVVKLKSDISSENLRAGTRGTVVMVYEKPGLPKAYEVEFVDERGMTLALLTLSESDLESEGR